MTAASGTEPRRRFRAMGNRRFRSPISGGTDPQQSSNPFPPRAPTLARLHSSLRLNPFLILPCSLLFAVALLVRRGAAQLRVAGRLRRRASATAPDATERAAHLAHTAEYRWVPHVSATGGEVMQYAVALLDATSRMLEGQFSAEYGVRRPRMGGRRGDV